MFGTLLLATVIGWEHLKVACGLSTTVAYRNLGNRTFFNTSIHAENRYGQLWIGYRLDLGPRAQVEVYHHFKYELGGWIRM
jgi:hypothetical protein